MTSPSSLDCFGLTVQGLCLNDILQRVEAAPQERPYWIVTANPEILLQARRDPNYREALRSADLIIMDGFGVQLMGRLLGQPMLRVTGVELAQALLERAAGQNMLVAMVGGGEGIAEQALLQKRQRLPQLRGLAFSGGSVNRRGEGDAANTAAVSELSRLAPAVVLVAFGHPKQELWIKRHLSRLPSVRVIIGVGGTFDYWAKRITRAPPWTRRLGLEWLYRLISEPRRLKRVWRAVAVFPAVFFWDCLTGQHKSQ